MIVIICCLGFSMSNVSKKRYLLSTATVTARIPILVGQGVLLLVYPLLGHLADVYLTRYRALKASLVILTIVCLLAIIYESIDITASLFGKINVFHQMYLGVVMTAIFIMYIIGSRTVRGQHHSVWTGSTTRGSHTKTDCLHPLVLLGSLCR